MATSAITATARSIIAGTVASDGAVSVSIKLGDKGATGTGHLSASSGAGTWHGIGSSGSLRRPLGSRAPRISDFQSFAAQAGPEIPNGSSSYLGFPLARE